jgi:hypothetical protein
MRATITSCLGVLVGIAAASGAEPQNIVMCRMSDPAICTISPHPQAQAQYRERCQQTPEKCKFRPDGTIEQWAGHMTMSEPVSEELRNRADAARAKLRALQEAK